MKLVCFYDGKGESYGVWSNDTVISLPRLAKHLAKTLPKRLEDFISLNERGVKTAEELLKEATKEQITHASSAFRKEILRAPIVLPPKIICLGLNYRDHIKEQNATIPDEPILFMKPRTAIIGPGSSIVKPSFVKQLDYEAELAIVVGQKAKNVSVSEAKSCIFGFTIINDVSARDIQFKDKQWTRGKGFDTFAPIGPCVNTIDQLQDTSDLRICTWVNEELRQNSTTKNMVFNVYEIVHHLSRVMTLEPCDIIATGTPSGVGFALKTHPQFLQGGDVVKIKVEGIGTLENRVIEEKS
jgi:2-keto-4-pentenoate hydratase/2-oxohepta-3-ene-1,7-dioic acid hydratase in catechol pathway